MNVLALKHFEFDDTMALEDWASHGGHHLQIVDPSKGLHEAWLTTTDLLVILGGPMSAYDDAKLDWLAPEKRFITRAIAQDKKILGICLGAQMLAELLGGSVHRHEAKEIGWHRITRTSEQHPWLDDLPAEFHSFQWHGDTYVLPTGARRLAESEACGQQAFAWGDRVLALQFHLETTPACIDQMLTRWANELTAAPYVQDSTRIRSETNRSEASFRMLHSILDRIAAS
ncbi:GMP synthase-like glutamine amidotransferase [Paenibacillus cellulosilyticus]|uniref:GMP synthase-like glutamine amidotransferase n=1 Tax=Paenibacillus cellulosilyticus TaxID=375489 RepID=A0A2V2YMU8_9BACL|nr:type 1 glutamine amidotransferase [Paenibacillus cellulosilyticus]PWV95573.1 GMP synthase-like glutamine amidotransferase [Paenibacillus cellulosilyticus]QKS47354.1 type 1 glutamine amidotransferase [Paenibacillus cellulosilyticus]